MALISRRRTAAAGVTAMICGVLLNGAGAQLDTSGGAPDYSVTLIDLDFTHDGSAVVTVGDSLRVHDVATGKLLQIVPQLTRCVACSPVAPDLFAVGVDNATVHLRRIGGAHPLREFKVDFDSVVDIAFSPDGQRLVCAGDVYNGKKLSTGEVRVWDVATGKLLHSIDFDEDAVHCLAFSADGLHLAVSRNRVVNDVNATSAIEIFDVADWRIVRSVLFKAGTALSVRFTPAGDKLLITGAMMFGKIWIADLGKDQPARSIEVEESDYFQSSCVLPDGRRFATGTGIGRRTQNGWTMIGVIQVRDLDSGKVLWSEEGHTRTATGVMCSPDGELVAGCIDNQVLIRRVATGELVRAIDIAK
jgi:WD40 repeat protein